MKIFKQFFITLAVFGVSFSFILNDVNACSRIVYNGLNGYVITARSMDWEQDIMPNLWILPRGIERNGQAGEYSAKWNAKYGSVVNTAWDIATSDGMNEKGLVANLLWLVESKYPERDASGKVKPLAISLWAQFVLDNFATVNEAVEFFKKGEVMVLTDFIAGSNEYATMHLSISDASGDNAIFEYIDGKLDIHHSRDYTVMTNSPPFKEQLTLYSYWKNIPGTIMLPGTNKAPDRFVRGTFYINSIPKTDDTRLAVSSVFSVIRNISVPLGFTTPNEPNISSTRWRSVSDQKNLVYYFETATTPNTFWVDFSKVDFSEGKSVKKLGLSENQTYAGDASGMFTDSAPFVFQGVGE